MIHSLILINLIWCQYSTPFIQIDAVTHLIAHKIMNEITNHAIKLWRFQTKMSDAAAVDVTFIDVAFATIDITAQLSYRRKSIRVAHNEEFWFVRRNDSIVVCPKHQRRKETKRISNECASNDIWTMRVPKCAASDRRTSGRAYDYDRLRQIEFGPLCNANNVVDLARACPRGRALRLTHTAHIKGDGGVLVFGRHDVGHAFH
mmetsp:Transcript_11171/g.16969  ORF Transcript_11171/g.16969 Transcript_11171/m.16969 type:complete len:203 (+) Transcript_11171:2187-2795(+)